MLLLLVLILLFANENSKEASLNLFNFQLF